MLGEKRRRIKKLDRWRGETAADYRTAILTPADYRERRLAAGLNHSAAA
jgi:hypothetical protein